MRKERPIPFSTDMVQAKLEGRKTMTRRTKGLKKINEKPNYWFCNGTMNEEGYFTFSSDQLHSDSDIKCPYGQPGDILWVKETYSKGWHHAQPFNLYKADDRDNSIGDHPDFDGWKPSIFMPKAAARIWLEITDIRVERLEDISQQDAISEGIKYVIDKVTGFCGYDYFTGGYNLMTTGAKSFLSLWRKSKKMDRHDTTGNPWVWVISFKVLSTTGRPHEKLGPF